MKINLISIIYKIFVDGLFVYLVGILDFGYLLVFNFRKCKYAQLHFFFSPNLHAPCTPRYVFCFFFVIGFNFIGLFDLSLLYFCTCILLHFVSVSYFSFIVFFQHIQIMCLLFVSIFIYILFSILSFMWQSMS